jgi:hypothetical protein
MTFLQRLLPGKGRLLRGVQEPLLTFDESRYWRVYMLTKELEADPMQVELAQALTLNPGKPHMGLKGTFGLFGSPQWWDSINNRKMPLRFLYGTIVSLSEAGQDSKTGINNTMVLELSDGTKEPLGIYVNNKKRTKLFQLGRTVQMVVALDEYKRSDRDLPDLGITLEVAISKPETVS